MSNVKVVMLNNGHVGIAQGDMTMEEMVRRYCTESPQREVWEVFAKVLRNTDRYVLAMGSHALAEIVQGIADKVLKLEFLDHEVDDCILTLKAAGIPLPQTSEGKREALNGRRAHLGIPPLPESLHLGPEDDEETGDCGDPACEAHERPEVN